MKIIIPAEVMNLIPFLESRFNNLPSNQKEEREALETLLGIYYKKIQSVPPGKLRSINIKNIWKK